MRARATVLVVASLALAATPVAAQGHGRGLGKGRGEIPAVAPSGPGTTIAIREFGSWLDDASLLEPGQGWMALSLGHYRSPGGHQTDFPVIDAGYGLTPRVQVGASVSFYRLSLTDGTTGDGLGDLYLTSKVSLGDPAKAKNGIGFAVQPLVEVLSQADPASGGRVFWALPVSVEMRRQKYRVYGSAGYFSRGAVFGSGALEVPLRERLSVTGALVLAHAMNDDPGADALGLSRTRADLTGGVVYTLTPAIAGFVSLGRTISSNDANSASFMLSGGMSFAFAKERVRARGE